MSRNGPIGYPGTRPPPRRPLPDDPFTAPPTGQPQRRMAAALCRAAGQQAAAGVRPAAGYPQPRLTLRSRPTARRRATASSRARILLPAGAAEPQGYAPQAAGHQLPFGSPAQARRAPQHAPDGAAAARSARLRSRQLHADGTGYQPAEPVRSSRPDPARCSTSTIRPFDAPQQATARPTPTSTRCWPRKRSSRAAAAAA